jgi:hypothetical protein
MRTLLDSHGFYVELVLVEGKPRGGGGGGGGREEEREGEGKRGSTLIPTGARF